MSEQNTSGIDGGRANSEAPDPSTQTDTASGARDDDRNEELDESPVPDPEETGGNADDDPGAD
jgi:hypothetical protein